MAHIFLRLVKIIRIIVLLEQVDYKIILKPKAFIATLQDILGRYITIILEEDPVILDLLSCILSLGTL